MVDGVRVHRVIGKESEGVTRETAEDYIAQARTYARTGRLNLPAGRKTVLTLRKATAEYLEKLTHEGGKDIAAKTPDGKDTKIENFFAEELLKRTIDGKKFNPENNQSGENGEYGKVIFAEKVIRQNQSSIDFSGFEGILDTISNVVSDYQKRYSATLFKT